jgi:hypothetical protein
MIENLSSKITRYGVSESFNSFIDGLRETPGLSDKKFRLADVNKLAQYLVCRNYGKACLELSYLAWAVVNYPTKTLTNSPLLDFFWLNENITPARFRQAFEQPYSTSSYAAFLNGAGLQLQLSQQPFVISPTRVGLLAVLLEVIITLAPEQLTIIEHTLKDTHNDNVIKKLSSDLQKQIYQFLTQHLVPAQQQRRFRYISQWLSEKQANEGTTSVTITDESIMSFWQEAGLDDTSPGYKLYASAFNDMIAVHQAIQQATQTLAIEHANTIGFDSENGEYSPDMIEEILFNEAAEVDDYTWLCHTPKFLTKSQWHFIGPLMQKQFYAKTLALSFARLAVFGQWQATIVQAKRKSSTILQQKLTSPPQKDYQQYQQQLQLHNKLIVNVSMAISHIFYHYEDSRYLGCILEFLPKSIAQQIKIWFEENITNIDRLQKEPEAIEKLNKVLFIQSQKLLVQSLEFNQVMQVAKTAFNSNNKEGFQHLPNIASLDTYQDGYEAITQCQHILQANIAKLSQTWSSPGGCLENYCSDLSIFKDMFTQLYGEVNA